MVNLENREINDICSTGKYFRTGLDMNLASSLKPYSVTEFSQ